MTLLIKKVGGVALVLLGGLLIAHGALVGPAWEIAPGVVLAMAGVALLTMKILYRNSLPNRQVPGKGASDIAR